MYFFIDTNLIVHYLILSNLKGKARKKYRERYKGAFDFVSFVLKNKNEKIKFFTSSLSQAEIYFAILDEYRCEKMYFEGVPLSCWTSEKWKTKDGK